MLPPREQLGWFTRPGDCEAIAEWMRDCPDALVVSTDMLCYGGLVASRTSSVSTALALQRLDALRELRRRRPDVTIFAFSIVMRLGRTAIDAESLKVHQAIGAYSQLIDRVQRLGDESARAELDAVTGQLDPDVLADYLAVRRRNHLINSAAIGLAADGVIDYLILAQEDSAPVGIHIPELMALRSQILERRLTDRVAIHPGADEVGMVLMARHCIAAAGQPVRLAVDYATADGAHIIPLFEHQPISDTVVSQVRAAGALITPIADADAVLFLHTPIGPQRDVSDAPAPGHSPGLAAQAESVVERTRGAAAAGLLAGIADVAYCNGADPELIAALERSGGAGHLSAYAGWNTAGNTLGTAITQLCLAVLAARRAAREEGAAGAEAGLEAARRFLACRFIDDYGYQACVRQKAARRAAEIGANSFALGEAHAEIEEFVRRELQPFADEVYTALCGAVGGSGGAGLTEAETFLPWRRLFEVEVRVG